MNENYIICYSNKKHDFHVANLELFEKSNCLCRLQMETLSLSLSYSIFLVAANVDSKDTLPSRWTQKLKKPFRYDVSLLSRQLVCFLFLSLSMWQATNHIIHSFFLSFYFTLTFSFLEDCNKNGRDLIFRSFFLSFFLSFFFKYYVYRQTDVHTEGYAFVSYYSNIIYLYGIVLCYW